MAAIVWLRALLSLFLVRLAFAALVPFADCTTSDLNTTRANGLPTLQWITWYVDAVYDSRNPPYNLSITVHGNITGTLFPDDPVPPSLSNTSYWSNSSLAAGKIVDLVPSIGSQPGSYTTLVSSWNVANSRVQHVDPQDFCNVSTGCPIIPAFPNASLAHLNTLPAFNLSQNMVSSYSFSTIDANFYVEAGDSAGTHILCVQVNVTPWIGDAPASLIRYLPVLVLILVAVATASAVFSPWGTWNIYHWTSNYGRDHDQLRLITPGFGDCLGYIQFAVLSGSLSLIYPGYFQPVIAQASWSTLMFNQSFVSHVPGITPIKDGVYSLARNGSTELDNMSTMRQVIGMGTDYDIWAGFMVWLLVVIGVLILLIQLGTLLRILYLFATRTQEEDLRHKNWPFSIGNVIRVVFNYFFMPLVTLCIYQMYLAAALSEEPNYLVALATITLVILLCFAGWLLYQILGTNPRSFLFDDLPTVLLYGPLYNTYSDDAAPFALVPIFVNVLRGIAFGGLQASGIAQIVLLSICEIIVILTLNAFRPFSSPTSMNLYHTAFAIVRIIVILLMIAFIPGLQVPDGIRTIIGYIILFLHAVVLFVGFFLHSLQTLVEVVARALGAGGEGTNATRGGLVKVFGVRQLSRRNPRASGRARGSMASEAAMLNTEIGEDGKISRQSGMRSRSMSASSALLLNSRTAGSGRQSLALDTFSQAGPADPATGSVGYGPGTPSGAPSILSYTPGQSQSGFDRRISSAAGMTTATHAASKSADGADPFFRPPRQRRSTNEALTSPGSRSRGSWHSNDWAKRSSGPDSEDIEMYNEVQPGTSAGTPSPAYLGYHRGRTDSAPEDPNIPKPDYATREVDYYYGVRGPALNDQPTRKLKTGPADPTGPMSSATGWFKNIFGNKSKDKHKGFEVVRGRGVRQGMDPAAIEDAELSTREPFLDEPNNVVAATAAPRKLDLEDEADAIGAGTRRIPGEENKEATEGLGMSSPSKDAPRLPEIDAGSSIDIPSRIGSRASRAVSNSGRHSEAGAPALPRHASTRSAALMPAYALESPGSQTQPLPTINQSPAASPEGKQRSKNFSLRMPSGSNPDTGLSRMPFGSLSSGSDKAGPQAMGSLGVRHDRTASGISDLMVEELEGRRPSFQAPPSPIADPDPRRGSIGYVSQHRASDNIVTPPRMFGGSTAELVDDSSVTGTERSQRATPEVRGAPHINF